MRDLRIRRREVQKLRLTKRFLQELRCEKGRDRQYIFDSDVPRLAVCVTENGRKSFYVYRRVNGRPRRIRLGGFPEIPLETARKLAEQTNSAITQGGDPQAAKRVKLGEATFADLFEHWLEHYAKPHKKTWAEDMEKFNLHLKPLHGRRLSEITKANIAALHVKLGRPRKHAEKSGWKKRTIGGPGAANRVLALISAVFNHAGDLGFHGPNPARGIRKFKSNERDRFLHADELPRFFQAVQDEPNNTLRDFFLLALYTGARRANVQAMRWDQVNLERKAWAIPDTKSGEPQTVYLSQPAVEILQSRKADSMSDWVFPGRGKSGHLEEPKIAWKRLLQRAGLHDLRVHDLRRTLGSWEAAVGASLPIIGKTLGHRQQSTTAIYARLDIDPVRQAVDRATAAMVAAAEVPSAD